MVTDLEGDVCEALSKSIQASAQLGRGLNLFADVLDWDDGIEAAISCLSPQAPGLILGADLLWADDAVDSLFEAVAFAVMLGWTFIYGASDRPSNSLLAKRCGEVKSTSLETFNYRVEKVIGISQLEENADAMDKALKPESVPANPGSTHGAITSILAAAKGEVTNCMKESPRFHYDFPRIYALADWPCLALDFAAHRAKEVSGGQVLFLRGWGSRGQRKRLAVLAEGRGMGGEYEWRRRLRRMELARRSLFRGSFLQFLELEFEIGSEFWPEVFSALSMMVPSIYAYHAAPELASNAIFPEGVWALAIGAMLHCPFSVAYHLASAVLDKHTGYDPMCTPFRTMDLSAIHVACIVYAWALSHGNVLFTLFLAILNILCVFLLFRRLMYGRPGGIHENIRVSCL
ncbi:eef-2, partial [Symbiodinium pilosum]